MEQKRVNAIFSGIVVLNILVDILIWFVFDDAIDLGNLIINEIFTEGVLILPAVAGMLIKRDNTEPIYQRLGFKKIKPSTVVLVILYGIAIMPIGTFANIISMYFTDNEIVESSDLYLSQNILVAFFFVAILGPFVEEVIFRGIIYRGYRKGGCKMVAALMSSILFGLMHMNLNQFIYALAVGILFSMLVEATGSIWSSFICHAIFNAESVCFMYLYDAYGVYEETQQVEADLGGSLLLYSFISLGALIVIAVLLKIISKKENREEEIKDLIFPCEPLGSRAHAATPVMWIGVVISVGIILLDQFG